MVKDFLYNFSGRIGSMAVGFLRAVIVPKYLGPEFYGVLNLFGLLRTFLGFLDLGIGTAYYHHMADLMAKKAAEERMRSEKTRFFSAQVLVNGLGVFLALLIAWYFYPRYKDNSLIYVVGIASIIISHCVVRLCALARQEIFLERRFGFIAVVAFAESFTGALLAIIGAVLFSLTGVLISQPLEALVGCLAFLRKSGGIPEFKFDLKASWETIKTSFLYFYGNFSFVILRMSDRLLIAGLLNMESLGYYALAHSLSENIKNFVASIHEVLTPRISLEIAGASNLKDLIEPIKRQTGMLFCLILFVNAHVIILSGLLEFILPSYGKSIDVLRILTISLTMAMFLFYPSLLICSKRVGKASVYSSFSIISSIVNVIVSYALILNGHGIFGVAIGTLSANAVMALLCFFYIHFFIMEKNIPGVYYASMVFQVSLLWILYFFRDTAPWILAISFNLFFFLFYFRKVFDLVNLLRKNT